ncbi:reactive intermediate/imine deaminase [Izhakiella australiensis]|uniref:Reactive intermediate/imine deaminase n=1 Tax=Izhakiella australiensis TaxID=1926881 RepID=A0A1S8YDV5_9GAMM|nr:Rid family detoxifying hydrolase [Izhakiella australiensis]OON37002.1 reactive intermediate/imine deaminase [Izhakiella australiensis]
MTAEKISTPEAPAAIGPYSQGIEINGLIFVSGQLPIDPQQGSIVAQDIESQTRQSIKNCLAILKSQKLTARNVIKTTVFLQNINDFEKVNAIYAETFGSDISPARSLVQVAALPKQALIEIECIAAR